ncbi:MAG: hypothetical protein M3N68_14130 [Actinomycetota bacterium]|nr:hypothetical protein [Actinomycetota bacterium]
MDDLEVIQAFVAQGARRAFGPSLHVEGDGLFLHGWWHSAFRVSGEAFLVRNEEPPSDARVLEDVGRELARRGLQQVGVDLPLIQPVTYAALSLGSVSWAVWSTDLAVAEQALQERAGAESFFEEAAEEDEPVDFRAELGGARRLAGLPPSLILTVGLDPAHARLLEGAFPDCRVESRALEELDPDACGSLVPSVILVDATAQRGREFVMELRASACGRFVPVVAMTGGADVPLGADEVLDPDQDPSGWVEPIRQLLP